ncbi:MAG: flippase [Patescibacteria group bacterium]
MSAGRVVKNTAYLLGAFAGQKILSFLYFTVVARAVGVEGTGRYFLALSLTTMFSILADIGLANVLVREVAKVPERAGKLLANVLGLKIILWTISLLAIHVVSRLLGYASETLVMISVASLVMVLDSTHLVFYAVMRGFQNLRYEAIGVVSGQVCTITAGLIFLKLHFPLPFLVVALLFGSLWNVAWSSYAIFRRFKVGPAIALDPAMTRFFLRIAAPFALAGIFSRVYSSIDSILLSKLVSESAVGVYGVGYKIAFAFQFLPMALAAAIYPAMSDYYVTNRTRLALVFRTSLKYLFVVVAPLSAGIALLADRLIAAVYGHAFTAATAPLQILMVSLIFAFLYWPAGSLLNASDRERVNTAVMAGTMFGNFLINLALIPRFGPVGAAIAALAGNLGLFLGAAIPAFKIAKPQMMPMAKDAIKIMAATVVMSGFVVAAAPIAPLVSIIAGAMVTYTAAVFALRGITMAELRTLAAVFGRGKGVSDIV